MKYSREKANSEYIGKIAEIFKDSEFNTNLSSSDILRYLPTISKIDAEDISFHICPGKQETKTVTYWIPNHDEINELIKDILGHYPDIPEKIE